MSLCFLMLAPRYCPAQNPELVVQSGHSARVSALSFSPDGKLIATGGEDSRVVLWELAGGKELRTLKGHLYPVSATAFGPDNNLLATGDINGTIRLWDFATGRILRTINAGDCCSLAFSPNGKELASASRASIDLWNVETGARIRTFAHWETVNEGRVVISPNGTWIAGGAVDGEEASIWNLHTGARVCTIKGLVAKGSLSGMNSMAFSPDSRSLAIGSEGAIFLANATTGSINRTIDLREPGQGATTVYSLAFSPDGRTLASAISSILAGGPIGVGGIYLWDLSTGKQRLYVRGLSSQKAAPDSQAEITGVAYSPDGKILAFAGRETRGGHTASTQQLGTSYLKLIDPSNGVEFQTLRGHTPMVMSVAISRDGNHIAAGYGDATMALWNAKAGEILERFALPAPSQWLAFEPKSASLLYATSPVSGVGGASLWSRDPALKQSHLLAEGAESLHTALGPEGKTLAYLGAAGPGGFPLVLHDRTKMNLLRRQDFGADPLEHAPWEFAPCLALSPDGRLLASSENNSVTLWKKQTGIVWTIEAGKQTISQLVFSPDGSLLATTDGQSLACWSVEDGHSVLSAKGQVDNLSALMFSQGGKLLLTGGMDGVLRVWDVKNGREVWSGLGHLGRITALAAAPEAGVIVTGSEDGTLRLWDANGHTCIASLIALEENAYVAATPEGYYKCPLTTVTGVGFRLGNHVYPFDQFDLKYNRPDLVLAALHNPDTRLQSATHAAYLKRLEKMGIKEAALSGDSTLPVVRLLGAPPALATSDAILPLSVQMDSAIAPLDRLNIWVNNVPLYGAKGRSLREMSLQSAQRKVDIPLSNGRNKIKISVLTTGGVESLQEAFEVNYTPLKPPQKPDLYVVAVGISQYNNPDYRLHYARKDAEDLVRFFTNHAANFAQVRILPLTDSDATRDNILQKAGEFLKQTRVEDQVIVFFAGHGLLDSKLDYYYGTVDMDFAHPEKQGLAYDAIESLLDGIAARKKLLLIDTCHSGELDKKETAKPEAAPSPAQTEAHPLPPGVKAQDFPRGIKEVKGQVGLQNSFALMQQLFTDLRRNSGTAVIAAASGEGYSLENDRWKNGAFTASVLEGLSIDPAVTISTLRIFVNARVLALTGGRQTPTTRQQILDLDWRIY